MPTIEEDFDYIVSTLVDHDCPFEARADREHLEEGARLLTSPMQPISDWLAELQAWREAERARQSRKGGV